jgi:hypothetical protein
MALQLFAGIPDHEGNQDGPLLKATFCSPRGLAMDRGDRNLFVVDYQSVLIRKICMEDGTVSTIAGDARQTTFDGEGSSATFDCPGGIVCHHNTGDLYVVDDLKCHIRKVSPVKDSSGTVQWIATSILLSFCSTLEDFQGIAIFSDTLFLFAQDSATILQSSLDGKETKAIGSLKSSFNRHTMLAADATTVYQHSTFKTTL